MQWPRYGPVVGNMDVVSLYTYGSFIIQSNQYTLRFDMF